MPDMDLVQRLREYGRDAVGDAMPVVSSAWLAQVFEVDPRTIAAAVRPYGVQPGEVERGVRGYSTAELAGIVLPGDEPDVLEGRIPLEVPHWSEGMSQEQIRAKVAEGCQFPTAERMRELGWDEDAEPVCGEIIAAVESDAVAVLSAAAGHDMTPALRAAGLL